MNTTGSMNVDSNVATLLGLPLAVSEYPLLTPTRFLRTHSDETNELELSSSGRV